MTDDPELVKKAVRHLHEFESKVWEETFEAIFKDDRLASLAKLAILVSSVPNSFVDFYIQNDTSEDELVVLSLAGRIANSFRSSLMLHFTGFIQPGLTMQRDLLETLNIMELFRYEPAMIRVYADAKPGERTPKELWQRNIREVLRKHEAAEEFAAREAIYQDLSYNGAHPNYHASRLLSPGSDTNLRFGPLFQPDWIEHFLTGLIALMSTLSDSLRTLLPNPAPKCAAQVNSALMAFNRVHADHIKRFGQFKRYGGE